MKTGLPTIFKLPGHRSFEYRPRYWDAQRERKEELEQLVREARTGEVSDERRIEKMRGQLEAKWGARRAHGRKSASAMQQVRLLFILAALFGLAWLFLKW